MQFIYFPQKLEDDATPVVTGKFDQLILFIHANSLDSNLFYMDMLLTRKYFDIRLTRISSPLYVFTVHNQKQQCNGRTLSHQ